VDIDESDSALKAAVEISIARQISVSRQQRTLLRPAPPPPPPGPSQQQQQGQGQQQGQATVGRARAATTVGGPSPIRKVVVVSRKEGRVVETKMVTPTEVKVVDAHPGAMRKSERVVLDGV
jgi:hypothetical protein